MSKTSVGSQLCQEGAGGLGQHPPSGSPGSSSEDTDPISFQWVLKLGTVSQGPETTGTCVLRVLGPEAPYQGVDGAGSFWRKVQ